MIADLVRANPPLEGAVFVGRIPVAMIRDAQHLTSAFKMDQVRYPRRRSSVPSDRFYEDLDLRFDPLGVDEDEPLLHYRSLRADSPQRVEKEIYSARMLLDGEPVRLRRYLATVVRRKKQRRSLRDALVVSGHGYHSSSILAWAGQGWLLREQMPWLFRPGGRVRLLYHADHRDLKARVLRAVVEESVNLAGFHAHGQPDTQYLLGLPPATTAPARIEALKRDFRNRLRRAKRAGGDPDKARATLAERHGVPDAWFDGAFDPEIVRKDEQADRRLDIRTEELAGVASAPEVIVFDECFNGRYIEAGCIADAYVFGGGGTVAAIANTVNVLQDVWADEGIGLIGAGMRIGRVHRMRPHLESHLIGDPTFRFAARDGEMLAARRALALVRGHRDGTIPAATCRDLLRNDPRDTVRLAALKCLAGARVADLDACLRDAVRDPNEMVRRQAVRLMGDRANPAFVAPLRKRLESRFVDRDLETAADRAADAKKRVRAIRTFRLYRVDAAVGTLIVVVRDRETPAAVRRAALEALGWFTQSRRRAEIEAACRRLERTLEGVPPEVRREAEKTRRRLEERPNDPFGA